MDDNDWKIDAAFLLLMVAILVVLSWADIVEFFTWP